jgi:hypothetical protein
MNAEAYKPFVDDYQAYLDAISKIANIKLQEYSKTTYPGGIK